MKWGPQKFLLFSSWHVGVTPYDGSSAWIPLRQVPQPLRHLTHTYTSILSQLRCCLRILIRLFHALSVPLGRMFLLER